MPNPPPFLVPYLERYPLQAGPLLTAVYDLTLSVGWIDTRLYTLGEWVVLIGHKRKQDPYRAVLPLPIHTTSLRPSSLRSIFSALSSVSISELPEPFPPLAPTMDQLREQITAGLESGDTRPEATYAEEVPRQAHETEGPKNGEDGAESGESQPTLDKETIYTAIVTPDSTVVYYKLSKGVKKPADIPDE